MRNLNWTFYIPLRLQRRSKSNVIIRFIFIFAMSSIIASSSFSLSEYLIQKISTKNATANQLNYATSLGITSAEVITFRQSVSGSKKWIDSAISLAAKQPYYNWVLAEHYRKINNKRDQQFWANQALKKGYYLAILNQAEIIDSQGKYHVAKQRIQPLIDAYPEAVSLATRLAIKNGDTTYLEQLLTRLDRNIDNPLLTAISHYQVIENDEYISSEISDTVAPKCESHIQFFASSLEQLSLVENTIKAIQQQPLFKQQFCFKTPRYIPSNMLNCQHDTKQAIQCDESIWQNVNIDPDVKYLAVVAPKGNANVNHGILYLDEFDSQQVIEHELLHLIGFIDEYPLPRRHSACDLKHWRDDQLAVEPIAKNIVVTREHQIAQNEETRKSILKHIPWAHLIKPSTPLLHHTRHGWQFGTPDEFNQEVGLFSANTCNNHSNIAFKPLSSVSKLQYFEESLPYIYSDVQLNNESVFNMPSYHYNVALAHKDKEQRQQAKIWFERAADHEKKLERQELISHGVF